MRYQLIFTLSLCAGLSGCGGGGGDSPAPVTPEVPQYLVSTQAGQGGTLSPISSMVRQGGTTTFTLNPNTGYDIESANGCEGKLNGNVYSTGPVNAACTITASFKKQSLLITAKAGTGGSITPAEQRVLYGEKLQFELVPKDGFDITTATGCGGKLQGSIVITAPITTTCTVEATFHSNTAVVFPDAGLDKVVRQALGLSPSDSISKARLVQLTNLEIPYGQIADLQGLQHATGLKRLFVSNNQITDLTPLANLTNLEDFSSYSNPIVNLQPLAALKKLKTLRLIDVPATDLKPLQGLQLTDIGLSSSSPYDLSPLAGMPLRRFYFWHNATADLSPLANAPLEYVDLYNSKVKDLSGLKNLTGLMSLTLTGSDVTDLSPLRQASRLGALNLLNSKVNNLDVLSELNFAPRAALYISGCIDQSGFSRHLEQLKAVQAKHALNLWINTDKRYDCTDTLAGTSLSMQAEVVNKTLQYSWKITGNAYPVHCALYLDQDDQLPGIAASTLQTCAATGSATYSGHQADQFRPAIWFDNGIGGEKLIKLAEVGAAPTLPALQSLDLSQITISAKPLLVTERDGLLRLHVTAAQSPAQLPKFQLDLQLNGNSQLLNTVAPQKLPASKVHRSLADAYQAIIPASWMQPGLQIKVLQDGQLVRTYTPQFAPARPLAIRIVPFQLGEQVATLPDVNAVKNAVRTYWPFSQIEVRARAPYQIKASETKLSAHIMLGQLTDLRVIEGENVYYYGYFKPEMGDGCCNGVGYFGSPIAVGIEKDNGEVLAHELGHNFGRNHVDCGAPSEPDLAYPYSAWGMGSVGLDLALKTLISPDTTKDIMSYCGPKHVSDYNVAAVQEFVKENPPAAFPTPAQAAAQVQSGGSALYLAGSLQGSTVQVRTLVPLSRAPRSEVPSGYSIRVLNEQGSWFEFNLQLLQLDHPTDQAERHFSVELPQMSIQRFEIWQNGVLVATQDNSAALAGSAGQQLQQQQLSQSQFQLDESANQLCVSWPAGKDASLSVIYQQNGEDTVLALNETASQFCRDSSALPPGGDWRLIWRQQLSVREFRQPR